MGLADIKPSAEAIRRYTEAGYWVGTTFERASRP